MEKGMREERRVERDWELSQLRQGGKIWGKGKEWWMIKWRCVDFLIWIWCFLFRIAKLKARKRQKTQDKKLKVIESRKNLADMRLVILIPGTTVQWHCACSSLPTSQCPASVTEHLLLIGAYSVGWAIFIVLCDTLVWLKAHDCFTLLCLLHDWVQCRVAMFTVRLLTDLLYCVVVTMDINMTLFDCRVVQKNLVFVIGLSPRLADSEVPTLYWILNAH